MRNLFLIWFYSILLSDRTQALLFYGSSLLADSFKLSGEDLWDRSGKLMGVRGPLGFLMQKAKQDGVSLPHEVQEGSVLAGLLIDAISCVPTLSHQNIVS